MTSFILWDSNNYVSMQNICSAFSNFDDSDHFLQTCVHGRLLGGVQTGHMVSRILDIMCRSNWGLARR